MRFTLYALLTAAASAFAPIARTVLKPATAVSMAPVDVASSMDLVSNLPSQLVSLEVRLPPGPRGRGRAGRGGKRAGGDARRRGRARKNRGPTRRATIGDDDRVPRRPPRHLLPLLLPHHPLHPVRGRERERGVSARPSTKHVSLIPPLLRANKKAARTRRAPSKSPYHLPGSSFVRAAVRPAPDSP